MSGTLSTIYNSTSFALQLHADAMVKLQEQASTGSRINRVSDAPSEAYQLLGLSVQQQDLENYINNISNSIDILETSVSLVGNMSLVITDAKTSLTQMVNGIFGTDQGGQAARDRVANQINDMLEQMLSSANTKYSGRYLFGGSNTDIQPYAAQRTNGEITAVTYQGSVDSRNIETAPGVQSTIFYSGDDIFRSKDRREPVFSNTTGAAAGTGTSNVKGDIWLTVTSDGNGSYDLSIDGGATKINVAAAANISNIAVKDSDGNVLYVDGTNITSAGTEMVRIPGTYDVFNLLINIRDLLRNEKGLPPEKIVELIDKSTESLDEVKNILVDKQSAIGAKSGFLDNLRNTLEDLKTKAEDSATNLQQADIAQLSVDLSRQQALYEMSLAVAGKLMSMSILDFIQ